MGIMNTATEWKRESSAEEKKHTTKIKKAKSSRECNWIWINGSGGGTSASDSAVSMEVWQKKSQNPLGSARQDRICCRVHKTLTSFDFQNKSVFIRNTSSTENIRFKKVKLYVPVQNRGVGLQGLRKGNIQFKTLKKNPIWKQHWMWLTMAASFEGWVVKVSSLNQNERFISEIPMFTMPTLCGTSLFCTCNVMFSQVM